MGLKGDNTIHILSNSDFNNPWSNLEIKVGAIVDQEKVKKRKLIYKVVHNSSNEERKNGEYIEQHKIISDKRVKFDANSHVDEICTRCKEGRKLISHNVNGVLGLLKVNPNCWSEVYAEYSYVFWQEVQLPADFIKENGTVVPKMRIRFVGKDEDEILQNFIGEMEKQYRPYWALHTNRQAGVAIFVRRDCDPLEDVYMILDDGLNAGRCIIAVFKSFVLVNLYCHNVGNPGDYLPSRYSKLEKRMYFLEDVQKIVSKISEKDNKPVIISGDFNGRFCTPGFVEKDLIFRFAQQNLYETFQNFLPRQPGEDPFHFMFDVFYTYICKQGYNDTLQICSHPSIATFNRSGNSVTLSSRIDYILATFQFVLHKIVLCKVLGASKEKKDFYNSDHSPVILWFRCLCNHLVNSAAKTKLKADKKEAEDRH
ncbi:hypothetical protein OROGR_023382 [Orobanche gracilis]